MNRFISAKSLLATVGAVAALGAASVAHARSDVVLSIGLNAPYGYVQPAPVYTYPQPVYTYPQPVYYSQPAYVVPQPVYRYRHHRGAGWGDADHDGVPNRYDRRPNNPYRY